jgi:hypothetical protein
MKKLFLIVMIAGLLAPAGVMAQKVYKDGSKVILDLTVAAGMPAGVVTSTPKYEDFTPSASAPGTNNGFDGSINATVYQKLEVAPHDLTGNGTIGSSAGGTFFTWVNAFNYCKNVTHDGEGWRLPTQRELQLMWIFKPALDSILADVGGTALKTAYYWAATEYNSAGSVTISFSSGYAGNAPNTSNCSARCVREVEL